MIAFHGKQSIKKEYLARVQAHFDADEIIKGTYWQKGKGCAVGCTIHGSDHGKYETELGIPRIIAKLEDGIFEALPSELAKTWPLRFLKAITPGSDLTEVWPKFAIWLLVDKKYGVIQFAKTAKQKKAIEAIASAYKRYKKVSETEWRKLADTAAAADADAAYAAAAYAAAAYAAYAASADAAYAASADAADAASAAAAAAYAASAAKRDEWRIAQSEKLLALLKAAKKKKKSA